MTAPYQVLARKYRPKAFSEVVGQETAAESLKGAIREGRLAHAYLFAGPRGVGKTSMARIFARAVNCAKGKGPTAEPCGRCDPCREIEAGNDADVVEMDAASNRGIDDARALREAVGYRPLRDRFRVYIVDECHMVTNEAWNALLKTLEEPPGHVRFVFATTALERVPETIRSRCQIFEFRRIGEPEIVRRLRQICEGEGFEADEALLASIAGAARGGMRDAQTLLDQLVAFAGKAPQAEDLVRLLGAADRSAVAGLFEKVASGDRAGLLQALDGLLEGGADEETLLDQALGHLRLLLVVGLCGKEAEILRDRETPEGVERIAAQARAFSSDRLEEMAQVLLVARSRLREAPALRRTVVELAFLRLCRGEEFAGLPEILARLEALERSLSSARGNPPPPPVAGRAARAGEAPAESRDSDPPSRASREVWPRVVEAVRRRSESAAEAFARARPASFDGSVVRLPVAHLRESERRLVEDPRNRETAEAALRAVLGRAARLEPEARTPHGASAAGEPASRSGPRPATDDAAAEIARQFDGEVLEDGR